MGRSASAAADLFPLAMAHLHQWLLQRQAVLLTPARCTPAARDAVMLMLAATASLAAELAEHGGHDVADFEAACSAARQLLDAAAAERELQAATAATLPPLDSASAAGSFRCPRGTIPPESGVRQEAEGVEAAKQRQGENLGCLPLPRTGDSSGSAGWPANLLAALQLTRRRRDDDVAAQHALCMVEREFFSRAASAASLGAAVTSHSIDALGEVVDEYRTGVCGHMRQGSRAGKCTGLPAAGRRTRLGLGSAQPVPHLPPAPLATLPQC